MDSATAARVARENARALEVGRRSHRTPRLWTGSFLVPRESEVSSRFGTGRTFNGAVASRHLGVDFRGAVGAPIRAANAGVVALVDRFFLGGRVVYIDHGQGVVTGYLHMSKVLVSPGDTVYEGMIIGENARPGDMDVNPTKEKKLTNMRSKSSDENIQLEPPRELTLEGALEYIEEDELIEVTPQAIRLRKRFLSANDRKKLSREAKRERASV